MADAPRGPRVIPNFAMDRPWSAPATPEEQETLAQMAVLSGIPGNNRAISDWVRQLDNAQWQQAVANAQAKGLFG